MKTAQQKISDKLVKVQVAMRRLQDQLEELKPVLNEFEPKNSRQGTAKWRLQNRPNEIVSTGGYLEIDELIEFINDERTNRDIEMADRAQDNAAYPR